MFNPIVIFLFYFGLVVSIVGANNWRSLISFGVVVLFIVSLNYKSISKLIKRIIPFLYFLPVFFLTYFAVSTLFGEYTISQIINTAGVALVRLILLLTIMSVYIEISKNNNIVHALRSLWSKIDFKWKWIDDIFIFLELTLRFYPSFQLEWDILNRSRKALGLEQGNSRWKRVKSIANDLPGIIVQNYLKAENTANVMKLRGYGNVIPRGVAQPILFNLIDLIASILIISCYWILNYYVAL